MPFLKNGALSLALVGGSALFGGCSVITTFDRSRIIDAGGNGDSEPAGDAGDPRLVVGASYIPTPLRPLDSSSLPPTRAFFLWQAGEIPAGKTVSGHELCRTSGLLSEIDEDAECPNGVTVAALHAVSFPLTTSASYLWKVRSHYDDGSYSEWSAVRMFLTDDSRAGWWFLDGNVDDASGRGHNGATQNGAAFAPGFLTMALSLDGTNDAATVADASDHDFGTGDLTLSAWVNPARDGVAEAILTKRDSSNGYELYRSASGQLVFFSPTCGNAAMGGALPAGAWHHVLATRSAGTIRLFVNGSPAGTGACPEDLTNSGELVFGCNGPTAGCAEAFQGGIDDVLLRNISSDETSALNAFCADSALAGVDPLPAACDP